MKRIFVVTLLLCAYALVSNAQFPEDALRYSTPGLGVGARSLSLGTAYTAVANDFSAVYWNPAGLGQIRLNEFSFGLSHASYGNTSSLFGNSQSFTNSGTSLNSLGLVYAVPTTRGSLVFALGYARQSDFTTGVSFKGFNPRSSIIQSWAQDGQPYPSDLSGNIAYQLYLANIDTATGLWDSKINDSLTQSGKVLEGGGLNHVIAAASVEATRNFFIGATLNFITGSYSYTRTYFEDDINNAVYTPSRFPFDFNSLSLTETIESDLSGFNAKVGVLYKFGQKNRFGLAIKTPSWVTVRETYSQRATSDFDSPGSYQHNEFVAADHVKNEYDVVTPFIFSAGLSVGIHDLMVSGDIEYTDWTQMEFKNADQRLLSFNTDIKSIYTPTVNLRGGAEYEVPGTDVRLRGGFMYLPSPYTGDPASFAQKFITAGVGFIFENAMAIDIGFAHGYWDSFRYNYNSTSKTTEKISTNNLIATVSYRF